MGADPGLSASPRLAKEGLKEFKVAFKAREDRFGTKK